MRDEKMRSPTRLGIAAACLACLLRAASADRRQIVSLMPDNFTWGFSMSAFQNEGASTKDGRTPSIWDTWVEDHKICDNGTAKVTTDFYHQYKSDIEILSSLRAQAFRFSISWSRVVKPDGSVNEEGIAFYNSILDELVAKNITPWVTLYHWDLPSWLSDDVGLGWTSGNIIHYFVSFADLCFERFGDRVQYWITFNEPGTFIYFGYAIGLHPPGLHYQDAAARHNVLLSHAYAVALYREKYQPTQGGKISLLLNAMMALPMDPSSAADKQAAEVFMVWSLAQWGDPLYFGDYPVWMRKILQNNLPAFSAEQRKLILGSTDFFAINHYTSTFAYFKDKETNVTLHEAGKRISGEQTYQHAPDGRPIGVPTEASWEFVVPQGFRANLKWIADRYYNPPVYIMENGVPVPGEADLQPQCAIKDSFRVAYFHDYILSMAESYSVDKVNIAGYFAWSLLDNFEWLEGYCQKFGVVHVDFSDPALPRTRKASADWFEGLIRMYQGEDNVGGYDVGDPMDFGGCPLNMAKGWYPVGNGLGPGGISSASPQQLSEAAFYAFAAALFLGALLLAWLLWRVVRGEMAHSKARAAAVSKEYHRVPSRHAVDGVGAAAATSSSAGAHAAVTSADGSPNGYGSIQLPEGHHANGGQAQHLHRV